jgi:Tfp pilus assembly protein PilN
MYAPTAALTAAILLVVLALAIRPLIQDRYYLAALEQESARLERIVQEVQEAEKESGHARRRLARLQDLSQRVEHDLATMRELSGLIPDQTWLHSLELNDSGVVLSGEGPAAASLLGALDASGSLTNASFSASLQKTEYGERFQVTAQRQTPQKRSEVAPAQPAGTEPPPDQRQQQGETLDVAPAETAAPAGNGG